MNLNKKHETTRMLRVIYTDAERLDLGRKLAECHNDLAQVNADLDRVKAEFKSRVSGHESTISDLSTKVSTGHRMESVKCRWNLDQPKAGMKQLVRLDTPTPEVIEQSDMTESDKQVEIELDPPAATPTGIGADGTTTVPADAEKK